MHTTIMADNSFLTRAEIELKRAERYRLFISMIMIDLSAALSAVSGLGIDIDSVAQAAKSNIRVSDYVSQLPDDRLALLFPETSRQGAEAAARRVTALIRQHIAEQSQQPVAEIVSMEMASYPDAAGAKTIAEFLAQLADQSNN